MSLAEWLVTQFEQYRKIRSACTGEFSVNVFHLEIQNQTGRSPATVWRNGLMLAIEDCKIDVGVKRGLQMNIPITVKFWDEVEMLRPEICSAYNIFSHD